MTKNKYAILAILALVSVSVPLASAFHDPDDDTAEFSWEDFCERATTNRITAADFICEIDIFQMESDITDNSDRISAVEIALDALDARLVALEPPVNTAPVVVDPPTYVIVGQNSKLTVPVYNYFEDAEDADSELVYTGTYEYVSGTTDLIDDVYTELNTRDEVIIKIATADDFDDGVGTYNVTLRATDTGGLFAEFTIEVLADDWY